MVAAENFYGDIARQIGGDRVAVVSIMNNPDQDPHLFETTPGIVRQIAGAQIVIFNGADYDPWMEKLLAAAPPPDRKIIVAADLVHKKAGDNPHLWYDPATMPAVAKALAAALSASRSPRTDNDYDARLDDLSRLAQAAQRQDRRHPRQICRRPGHRQRAGVRLYGEALGLTMRNERFQLAIMNDTEPSARDVAAFEQDLKDHKVRVCSTTSRPPTRSCSIWSSWRAPAKIPVVGVTETEPPGMTYQDWMLSELNDTEKALAGPSS